MYIDLMAEPWSARFLCGVEWGGTYNRYQMTQISHCDIFTRDQSRNIEPNNLNHRRPFSIERWHVSTIICFKCSVHQYQFTCPCSCMQCFLFITSTKEVLFLPASVRLSVCLWTVCLSICLFVCLWTVRLLSVDKITRKVQHVAYLDEIFRVGHGSDD